MDRKMLKDEKIKLLFPDEYKRYSTCTICGITLPRTRAYLPGLSKAGEFIKPSRVACLSPECESSKILKGSSEYRIKVCGGDPEKVKEANRIRTSKSIATQKKNGHFEKDNNPFSKGFWMKKGMSEEEAIAKLKSRTQKTKSTKKENGYYDIKENNPFSKEFWVKNGLTKDEADRKVKERNSVLPEFWVKRGLTIEEAKVQATKAAKTNSLAFKIEKYGEDEGLQRYLETGRKLSASWTPASSCGKSFSSSRKADLLFKSLYKFFRREGFKRDDIQCNLNKGELFIREVDQIYFYDFCLKPKRMIIEFNGEHVHARKETMTEEEFSSWRHAYSKISASEYLEKNSKKIEAAQKRGYNLYEVWSKDLDNFEKIVTYYRSLK